MKSPEKYKQYYWSDQPIADKHALWNIVIGERSNGKTTGVIRRGMKRYLNKGYQLAVIRRYQEDFRPKRSGSMFDSLECNGYNENEIKEITKGKYDTTYYYSGKWYLAKYNEEGKKIPAFQPFAFAFAITEMEHDKSTSWPMVRTLLFDEALSRNPLPNEFTLLSNVLSTIIRDKGPEDGIEIWLLGNTVNKYSPIFTEMGINKYIPKMNPGDINVFKYEGSDLTVAVEYCASAANKGGKKSDVFFAFNTAATKMITTGAWEIPSYPHNAISFRPKDIKFIYFIIWEYNLLQCEIVQKDNCLFTFIHKKTTEIKDTDRDIIFDKEYHQQMNYYRNIAKPATKLGRKLWWFFQSDNVYYQDNEVGELVNNYLKWCSSDTITTY